MVATDRLPWMRAIALLVLVLVVWSLPTLAARGKTNPDRREFKILMDSRKIGRETYTRVRDTDKGIERIEARTSAFVAGNQLEFRQNLEMTAGTLAIREYHLTITVKGGKQQVCICGVDDKVHFEVRAGGQERRADPPTPENLVLLDNLVVNHYEVLYDRYDWQKGGRQTFHAAVPQVMQIIPLVAEAVPAPGGTFQGKSIALRQLRLTLAGLVINVLGSDAVPGRLLAVEVPMQKLELIRDGFAVVAREAAAEEGGFRESEVTIDSHGITLGGTLTLPDPRPAGAHLLPGVVLVHGSGPNDRDETIGPNKPFRDLAHDLARRGIAVLRYDKRTFAAKDTLDPATLTVEEETIADAAAAASLLIGHEAIDPRRVYLAGHSLGGMLAPWIARREPRLAGLILLAGSNLPLDEMIVEQSEYLARRQGVSEQAEERIEELRKLFARLRAGKLPEDQMVVGAAVPYWKDLLARDPLATLAALPQPVLVLAGEKDYQVPPEHYRRWLEACRKGGKKNCSGRLFPGLNHLFMPVEGPSDGTEYQIPSRVAPEVAEAMASWILGDGGDPIPES